MEMRFIIFILLLFPVVLFSQFQLIPRNSDIHNITNRITNREESDIHTSIQYFSSKLAWESVYNNFESLNNIDKHLAEKLILKYPEFWPEIEANTSNEIEYVDSNKVFYSYKERKDKLTFDPIGDQKPIFQVLYKNPNYLYSIQTSNFLFNINPVLNFGIGRDNIQGKYIFQNTRGIEMNGHIDHKIYFYSNILENQASFPKYIVDYFDKFKSLPGQGLVKPYNSIIFGKNFGYDYLNAQAYIASSLTKSIGVEFGHGRNFIGNGYRSLLLSDFSNNNLYLKFNTKVWKLHYQNLFSQLIPLSLENVQGDQVIPRKYSATHYLCFKHNSFEIGLFETTVFGRDDGFELQYLNPVILYRLVEHNIKSSDNVIVGVNTSWSANKDIRLYGQIILDEFHLILFLFPEENQEGWWAHKYGFQAGIDYFNAFKIPNLNLKGEVNMVMPYTYGHRDIASYSHYDMALAHPLGANFREFIGSAQYYVTPKLSITSKNFFYTQGLDKDGLHYGSDIRISNTERFQEFNNFFLQGNLTNVFLSNNRITYEIFNNYFLDLNVIYRKQNYEQDFSDYNDFIFSAGIRVNYWESEVNF